MTNRGFGSGAGAAVRPSAGVFERVNVLGVSHGADTHAAGSARPRVWD